MAINAKNRMDGAANAAHSWNNEEQAAEPLNLQADFPVPSAEAWRKQVAEDLEGADFDKKLVWRPLEGFAVQPLYRRSDLSGLAHTEGLPGFAPFARGTYPLSGVRPAWQVRQDCAMASPEEANAALRDGLARGQTAVGLRLDDAARQGFDGDAPEARDLVGQFGTTLSSINGLRIALADIDLEKHPVSIRTGRAALPVLAMLLALARERGLGGRALTGSIEHDPLHGLLKSGRSRVAMEMEYRVMADMVNYCAKECPGIRPVTVNSSPFHNAGASAVQEVGCAMGVGVEYLRETMSRGVDADVAARAISFAIPVSTNMFIEIAKLRAARILWAKIAKALGVKSEDGWRMFLHVRTSAYTKTVHDPYNNLLRSAVEGFAAAVGGCDSMYVAPLDEPMGQPDEITSRLARNQQLLLQEEAHLSKVVDPGGGSYYIEALTDAIAREAWKFFQEIESVGGMTRALLTGKPQAAIRETAAKRAKLISGRRQPIVGISNYPNPKELPLPRKTQGRAEFLEERRRRLARLKAMRKQSEVRELLGALTECARSGEGNLVEIGARAAAAGATIGEFNEAIRMAANNHGIGIESLKGRRASAPFEALRARAELQRELTGELPKIFLVPTGPLAMRRARADFSIGFFGAAGFEAVEPAAFKDVEAAARGAMEAEARVFVICSDDATYPAFVPGFAQRLKAARPDVLVIVAGYPEEHVEALKNAGVDEFVHIRADAVDSLTRVMDKLGMPVE